MAYEVECVLIGMLLTFGAEALPLDERPAEPGEWGFRPANKAITQVNPPSLVWRPQKDAVSYRLQIARSADFREVVYEHTDLEFSVHCPPRTLDTGDWYWRFAYRSEEGLQSPWSQVRQFTVPADARSFPMPVRETLFSRIPTEHPRLFVRPEQLARLRELATGELRPIYDRLVSSCERIMAEPPPTEEPPTYPDGIVRGSDPWREIWWGNRRYTSHVLNSAATLAFTQLLGGQEAYGELARRLLMDAAEWDPKGATGYRYNDEAGMPYNYYFSRTYTFLYDLLSEEERAKCREVMAIRGEEMYRHLCPNHLWKPYSSHSNRAWHFLGEIAIAFMDEIEGTRDWLWFTMNVFYNSYPVWSDDDGGWHEGLGYWRSYIDRFLWWADIMRVAMEIDAYEKPYFSQVGYFPMYLQPPGAKRGGFGDLCGHLKSDGNVKLMSIFAAQAQNPNWQWYVDAHGGPPAGSTYVDFIRGALPSVTSEPPGALPDSKMFEGTGLAMLHTDLMDAKNDVFLEFKSSPFGSHSHGYDAQNSFVLYAYSEPLLIRSGRRDSYGSKHHRDWMWETKSVNSILVNNTGQRPRSSAAVGRIVDFHTSKAFDYVAGEASDAYPGTMKRFTRHILSIKPGAFLIFDQLEAPEPSTFQWCLHAPVEMSVDGQHAITIEDGQAGCQITFLTPDELVITQTDQFDPPPRPRIKLTQWHLQASTTEPASQQEFVTIIRPYRLEDAIPVGAELETHPNGYACRLALLDGQAIVLLKTMGDQISGYGAETRAHLGVVKLNAQGKAVSAFAADGAEISYESEPVR